MCIRDRGQSVHRKSDSDLADKDFTLSEDGAPVITFVTESTASTPLTGVVTDVYKRQVSI